MAHKHKRPVTELRGRTVHIYNTDGKIIEVCHRTVTRPVGRVNFGAWFRKSYFPVFPFREDGRMASLRDAVENSDTPWRMNYNLSVSYADLAEKEEEINA